MNCEAPLAEDTGFPPRTVATPLAAWAMLRQTIGKADSMLESIAGSWSVGLEFEV